MTHSEELINMKVLMVDDELSAQTASGRAARTLIQELRDRDITVIEATSNSDGQAVVLSDPSLESILLDWTLGDDDLAHDKARALLSFIRRRNTHIPIFLIARRGDASTLTSEVMREADELIWMLEDTTFFIAGRVLAAIRRYREAIVPPLTKALISFAQTYEYSWHTPGHAGGTAFLKSPVGRVFYDYFGENLLRSDLSISVGELGSLLDHSGPIGDSEKYAARVFGAQRSYTVTNGTSTSNRVIMMSSVTRGDYVLCDRNAHKSIEQALTLTGAIPTYLLPTRNHLGIIGPIHPESLTPKAVKTSIAANPLAKDKAQKALHTIITNSTYDGLIYLVPQRRGFTRPECRPHPLRRSVVRLCALLTRSTEIALVCMAIQRIIQRTSRRSLRRHPLTSCWRRCRKPLSSTCATGVTRWSTDASTKRS